MGLTRQHIQLKVWKRSKSNQVKAMPKCGRLNSWRHLAINSMFLSIPAAFASSNLVMCKHDILKQNLLCAQCNDMHMCFVLQTVKNGCWRTVFRSNWTAKAIHWTQSIFWVWTSTFGNNYIKIGNKDTKRKKHTNAHLNFSHLPPRIQVRFSVILEDDGHFR